MGILQLYLRAGKQNVSLPNNIPKGTLSVKHIHACFNVQRHGFYMITVQLPFVFTNNTQSNLSKRGLLIPIKHDSAVTSENVNIQLGEVEISRNFEVNVDLDNGHQVVLETATRVGGAFAFNTHPSGNSWAEQNYYSGTPPSGAYVSLGLDADAIVNGSTIPTTSGVINGPKPFLYAFILTLEYEDGLIEQRLQQLMS